MERRTIYLAGPMRGLPDLNFPMFNRVAWSLRDKGHVVFNPAEFGEDGGIRQIFLEDAEALMQCDTIVLLPGWRASTGAVAEYWLARAVKDIEITEWNPSVGTFLPVTPLEHPNV